jgi:hypothetical protein
VTKFGGLDVQGRSRCPTSLDEAPKPDDQSEGGTKERQAGCEGQYAAEQGEA